jgi:hypothetical protein
MGGIVYDSAREKKARKEDIRSMWPRHNSPEPPGQNNLEISDALSTEIHVIPLVSSREAVPPPKGILKTPRVRFLEDIASPQALADLTGLHKPARSEAQTLFSSTLLPPPILLPSPGPPPPPTSFAPPSAPPPHTPRPPSIYTKQIESDRYLSASHLKVYTRFFDELGNFVEQQGAVTRERLRVQERRTELRRLRESVSKCDLDLINYVRECVTKRRALNFTDLTRLFDAAQTARDLVGPSESEYEPMKVRLGAEEHKLGDRYETLEARFEQFFTLKPNASSQQSVPSDILYEESTSTSSRIGNEFEVFAEPRDLELFHGAWIGEQVAIGQEPICADSQIDRVLEQRERRERTSRRLRRPTLSSDTERSWKQLRRTPAEVGMSDVISADLVGIAGAEETNMTRPQGGIEPQDQILTAAASYELSNIVENTRSPKENPTKQIHREGKHMLLRATTVENEELSNDEVESFSSVKSSLQDYLISFKDTNDRVNRWILHQLRLSRHETYSLQREIHEQLPDLMEWSMVALSEWSNDSLSHGGSYSNYSVERDSGSSLSAAHHIISMPKNSYSNVDKEGRTRRLSSFVSNEPIAGVASDEAEARLLLRRDNDVTPRVTIPWSRYDV